MILEPLGMFFGGKMGRCSRIICYSLRSERFLFTIYRNACDFFNSDYRRREFKDYSDRHLQNHSSSRLRC
ncbi:hypothetical protein HanIR_Chr13g0644431 [Helianthus annuus]|nr:hypothetical protein HanIR_Chr13g0644431 [Helianthus annuus]